MSGNKHWTGAGGSHRVDGEPTVWPNGTKCWYKGDAYHRIDGPAVMYLDGRTSWYVNDLRVRTWSRFQKLTGLSDEDITALILKYGDIT